MKLIKNRLKENFIYPLLFAALAALCTYLFTWKLRPDEFLYMGDQALRVNLLEANNYLFHLRRLVNLGNPNGWEFVTQFWDTLYFWTVYKLGITSLVVVERILFFIVLFATLSLSFAGFRKLSGIVTKNTPPMYLIFVTFWYTFNPYTLNLWHGGIYNIDAALTYALAPLALYFFHVALFGSSTSKDKIILALLLFLQSFVFWMFAPFILFILIYICVYIAVSKFSLGIFTTRLIQIGLLYLPLASVIIFPILYELSTSSSVASATLAPAFGNQQGGLWYQILMLFSWGIYNVWTPRSLYSFHGYYFSPLYVGATLAFYVTLLAPAISYCKKHKLTFKTGLHKLIEKKFAFIFILILAVSLFFAKGKQEPLGEIFLFLYERVPLFSVFRTPDIRFGFSIVLALAVLLTIVAHYYRRLTFAILIFAIIALQTLPFWTGWGIYGENTGGKFYDRVVKIPDGYKEAIDFLNNNGSVNEYILAIPPSEYARYEISPGEQHIGQDLLSKYVTSPFIYLSEATGIDSRAYAKLTQILKERDFVSLREFPIKYIFVRRDVLCDDCLPTDVDDLGNLYPVVFENKTFTVYKATPPKLIQFPDSAFKQIDPMRYEISLKNLKSSQRLIFYTSFDKGWGLFPKTSGGFGEYFTILQNNSPFASSHKRQYGYANSWEISPDIIKSHLKPDQYSVNPDGSLSATFILYFQPQAYYWLFLYITAVTLSSYLIYLFFVLVRSDEAKRRNVRKITDVKPSYNHILTYGMVRKYIKGKALLDVGCWTGQYVELAKNDAKKIIGVDPGTDAIKIAKQLFKKNKNVSFKTGFVQDLKLPPRTFDVVLFSEVIEHIPKSSEKTALRQIRRVLRDGGFLILTTPYKSFFSILLDPAFFILGHRHYSKNQLSSLLIKEGFSIRKVAVLGGFVNLIAGNLELFYKHLLKKKFSTPTWMLKMIKGEWGNGFVRLLIIAQKSAK